MDFRIRPSSKKSNDFDRVSDRSLVELPMPKSFQQNQGTIIRSLSNRIQALQSSYGNQQDIWRKERQISNAGYLQIQKKIDFLEYKVFSNEKGVKQLNQLQPLKQTQQNDSNKAFTQNEINLLKQALNHERETHRQYTKHQKELYQQLGRRQLKLEQEIKELLYEQKQETNYQMKGQVEQIRANDMLKQKKMEQQYEMIRNVLSNTERKIYDEFERKLKNQTIIKEYVQDRLVELKQQMAIEQKGILSKENKFVKEIRDSIQSVMSIIQGVRRQFQQQLAQTQKLSATNIKRLSMSIDLIKQKLDERTKLLGTESSSLQSELAELKGFVTTKLQQNRELIMQMEEENENVKGSRTRSQKGQENGEQESSESIKKMKNEMNNWKAITQQKNLNVFKEISNTLKAIKVEWKKENDQITSEVGSFKQSLTNVKKSVPLQIKKSVQAIITVFNNEFDTLAQQLDTVMEMIALAKQQNEKYVQDELKKTSNQMMSKVKQLVNVSQKESNLYAQKAISKHDQNIKNHIQIENKYIKDMMIQKHSGLQNQLGQVLSTSKKNSVNTNHQLQDFTLKLKSFNENYKDYLEEQRKDDMKRRIQLQENMRKNSSNLMDICYKKCQFLVQGMKKAMEMNQMKDKVDLTRDVQILKEDSEKKMFQNKQDLITEINQKIDKMAQERQNSDEVLQQNIDQQITTLKRTMQLQIQGAKQQQQSTKQELQVTKQELENAKGQLQNSKKQIQVSKIQLDNTKKELQQNKKQLQEKLRQLNEKGHESTQELQTTVNALRQTMWKMQAMSFSEQAKNKAIFDRMGEDINDISTNMTVMSKEIKK